MLIAFSGLDGAGKSTQIQLLSAKIVASEGKVRVLWGRGGYTPGFEALKGITIGLLPRGGSRKSTDLKKREKIIHNRVVQYIWLLVATLDLLLYWGVYLRFLRLFGYYVLCDRYVLDTHLDFERNFPAAAFTKRLIWRVAMSLVPSPTVHFLFLIDPNVSVQRSLNKNEPFPDDIETLRWRWAKYTEILEAYPDKFIEINGEKKVDEIKSIVYSKTVCAGSIS